MTGLRSLPAEHGRSLAPTSARTPLEALQHWQERNDPARRR